MHTQSERAMGHQQARQLGWTLAGRPEPARFLIRDWAQEFTDSFDGVFLNEGIQIIRTPS